MIVGVQWSTQPAGDWQWIDSRQWVDLPKKPEPEGDEVIDGAPGWVYALNIQGVMIYADHYAVLHDDEKGCVHLWHWNDDPDDYAKKDMWGKLWQFYPVTTHSNTRQRCTTFANSGFYAHLARKPGDIQNINVITARPQKMGDSFSTFRSMRLAVAVDDPARSIENDYFPGVVAGEVITPFRANGQSYLRRLITLDDGTELEETFDVRTTLGAVDFLPFANFPYPEERLVRHGIWLSDQQVEAHNVKPGTRGWRRWSSEPL